MDRNGVSLYEYFISDGKLSSGLVAEGDKFSLNGKDVTIYSGAMHYFRIHPHYWRDTFKKLRAAGLNTVETYMAWNLHNPEDGEFDFGKGDNAMSAFLDIRAFIKMAQEEDLFVILRPGPYICSEFDFGGMPYWLLKDPTMSVRTTYSNYMSAVHGYFKAFSPLVNDLTFMKGGPIIAMQIENEYGCFGYEDDPRDVQYLRNLQLLFDENGFKDTLYFTSDSAKYTLDWGALPGVLQTTNFQVDVDENLDALQRFQSNRPMMVMEFWTGWYDQWLGEHATIDPESFASTLEAILKKGASVNMYMFIGGTNFGFLAGANRGFHMADNEYAPDVTSYDYDAPLSEAGDYTEKYKKVKDIIAQFNPLHGIVKNPCPPSERAKVNFGTFPIQQVIDFDHLVQQSKNGTCKSLHGDCVPVSMEDYGLDYGYIVYSKTMTLDEGEYTLLIRGHVRDMAQIMINGKLVTEPYTDKESLKKIGFWHGRDQSLTFNQSNGGIAKIDIMVENLGRVNYGKPHFFKQRKGLWQGDIMLNDKKIEDWDIKLMGFKKDFVESLSNWSPYVKSYDSPSVYRVNVDIDSPADTFLDMRKWKKGVVILNGFNLGRYWCEGPQRTLYIPAPLLNTGKNEFIIFEQYLASDTLRFIDHAILSKNGE